jgi:hypothetical protein
MSLNLLNFILLLVNYTFICPNLSIIIFFLIAGKMLVTPEVIQTETYIPTYIRIWESQERYLKYITANINAAEREGTVVSRI